MAGFTPIILSMKRLPVKIISGGQTGVDRAALDAALALGIPCGGFCPKHRRAEDGTIPLCYPLNETKTSQYPERTRLNIENSDGTIILFQLGFDRGTTLTASICRQKQKPLLIVDLDSKPDPDHTIRWIEKYEIRILNIAGPREKSSPGIYNSAHEFLLKLFMSFTVQDRALIRARTN